MRNLLIFDIETVLDTSVVVGLMGKEYEGKSEKELREALIEYHLKITDGKNSFARQLFHKVVCAACLLAKPKPIEGKSDEIFYSVSTVKNIGDADASEKEIVSGFFDIFNKQQPLLVSFNGKMFDVPVLKYRAMKHGISAGGFHKAGDKWGNYNNKFSKDWHCDLIEALSDYGTSAKIKLKEICALLNVPCKIDGSGNEVEQMYDDGEIDKIRDYCEQDVVGTYLVYLSYALHTGDLTTNGYEKSLESLYEYIKDNDKQNLADFKPI